MKAAIAAALIMSAFALSQGEFNHDLFGAGQSRDLRQPPTSPPHIDTEVFDTGVSISGRVLNDN